MLGVFERQIRDGGPITVTHPDVTPLLHDDRGGGRARRSRPAPSAARRGARARHGRAGADRRGRRPPGRAVGRGVEIVYTGLRPGEKLHEVLFGAARRDVRPIHPLISQVPVPPLSFDDARAACSVDGRLVLSAASLEVAAELGLGGSDGAVVVDDDGGR